MNPPPLAGLGVAEDGISTISSAGAIQNFDNDLNPEQHWADQISPMAINVLTTPVTATAQEHPAFKHCMSYISCTKDNAIDLPLQNSMVAKAGIERVATMETDHSPFLKMPRDTAGILMEQIESFR